ncbi:MAG: YHYH protein [Chthoniobacteraceae bacterium]
MKPIVLPLLLITLGAAGTAPGHDSTTGEEHAHYDWTVKPPEFFLAQANVPQNRAPVGDRMVRTNRPAQAAVFEAFAPKVSVRWDEKFLFVEGNGLPSHKMMVGITAWQQQVPLPQNYTGTNAWQIPLVPVPAKEPRAIKNNFLRGAIALAVNGIPIFNPQNNRGEISQDIGELDQWGGHCGRADDYHYHAAPLHLQSVVGKGQPIAFALDGYPIYGLTEPDGSQPAGLDAFNGHTTQALGYHYHASTKYPYVNGGFHGEVIEREGQVDPQPRANPVREALRALRGAKITGFASTGANSYKLSYEVNGDKRAVLYAINADGTYPFEFQNGSERTAKETYKLRERGAGRGGPDGQRPDGERPPRNPSGGSPSEAAGANRPPRSDGGPGGPTEGGGANDPSRRPRADGRPGESASQQTPSPFGPDAMKKPSATFVLTSPEVQDGGALPTDYSGDGSGATLPLSWKGSPTGTKGYALIMDHLAPGNVMKHYWTIWDIPATTTSLPKNVKGVGKIGTSFKGKVGYEPPHSQGPGAKTYVLTVYALSAPLQITQQPREVNRDVLLAAMKDKVLASASLRVVYTRSGASANDGQRPQRRESGPPPNEGPKPAPRPSGN